MIFAITTVSDLKKRTSDNGQEFEGREYHAVGYYLDKHKAWDIVTNNEGDIRKGNYRYAVIESIPEGMYAINTNREEQWFIWSEGTRGFTPCDKPHDLSRTVGFAVS